MKKAEQAKIVKVLTALNENWSLIDESPDIDFLIGVNEDRDELDFRPKKELVREMERLGLIKNLNKQDSYVREPYIYYEGDLLKREWREITEAGSVFYEYKVTSKGHNFLHNVDKPSGTQSPKSEISKTSSYIERKPLKVIVYDRFAIEKLVDEFVNKSKTQIETAFLNKSELSPSAFSPQGLMCGLRIWQRLKPKPLQNGGKFELQIEKRVYDGLGNIKTTEITDHPIAPGAEVELFWRGLNEKFMINESLSVKRAEPSEAAIYLNQMEIQNSDFPPPNLSIMAVVFIVQSNESKFVVINKSELNNKSKRFEPTISWIELVESSGKQK